MRQGGQGDAGGEALHVDGEVDVPQGLVEIVDVEQRLPLGAAVDAEIADVAVAAGLNRDARHRYALEVRRHDGCGPAQEGERVGPHPLAAQGHELGEPAGFPGLEDREGIALRCGPPVGVRLPRDLLAQALARRPALVAAAGLVRMSHGIGPRGLEEA